MRALLALVMIAGPALAHAGPADASLMAALRSAFGADAWPCANTSCHVALDNVSGIARHDVVRCYVTDSGSHLESTGVQGAGAMIARLADDAGSVDVASITCDATDAMRCTIAVRDGDATIAEVAGSGAHAVRSDKGACTVDGKAIDHAELLAERTALRLGAHCDAATCSVAARVRCTTKIVDDGLTTVDRCDVSR